MPLYLSLQRYFLQSKGSPGIQWLSNYSGPRFILKLGLIGAQIICVQFEKMKFLILPNPFSGGNPVSFHFSKLNFREKEGAEANSGKK